MESCDPLWMGLTLDQLISHGIALLSAIFGLSGIAWGFRERGRAAKLGEPYIFPPGEVKNGSYVELRGPNADAWEISQIRVTSPKRATFLRARYEKDDGGSIVRSWYERLGRTITYSGEPVVISKPPGRVVFKLSLKTDPRISMRRPKRIKSNV